MKVLAAILLSFFLIEFLGYAFHRLMHWRRFGALYRAHMTHHQVLYPADDFLSDGSYRSAGADGATHRFVVAAVIVLAVLAFLLPVWLWYVLVLEMAVLGLANNYVHDAVHVRGHALERFQLYRWWRANHLIHHRDQTLNYGIITFVADDAFRTRSRPDSASWWV